MRRSSKFDVNDPTVLVISLRVKIRTYTRIRIRECTANVRVFRYRTTRRNVVKKLLAPFRPIPPPTLLLNSGRVGVPYCARRCFCLFRRGARLTGMIYGRDFILFLGLFAALASTGRGRRTLHICLRQIIRPTRNKHTLRPRLKILIFIYTNKNNNNNDRNNNENIIIIRYLHGSSSFCSLFLIFGHNGYKYNKPNAKQLSFFFAFWEHTNGNGKMIHIYIITMYCYCYCAICAQILYKIYYVVNVIVKVNNTTDTTRNNFRVNT